MAKTEEVPGGPTHTAGCGCDLRRCNRCGNPVSDPLVARCPRCWAPLPGMSCGGCSGCPVPPRG